MTLLHTSTGIQTSTFFLLIINFTSIRHLSNNKMYVIQLHQMPWQCPVSRIIHNNELLSRTKIKVRSVSNTITIKALNIKWSISFYPKQKGHVAHHNVPKLCPQISQIAVDRKSMDYASNVVKLFKLSSSEPRLPIAWASPIPMYQTVSALKIKKKKHSLSLQRNRTPRAGI